MDFDKEWLPRWGWLLVGLFGLAVLSTLVNATVFAPLGLPESYFVVTTIAAMAPVLIYVGVWHDDDRQHYWDHTRSRILSDLVFVVTGAALGAAFTVALTVDTGFGQIVRDLLAMTLGFVTGWLLFWFRNPELYRDAE